MSKIQTLSPKLSQLIYGGDYNPEQWPEEVWLEDVRLMREAGVNLVSLPVFGWAKLEPKPGQYDLDWLERIMDLLYQHGVYTNLATATASPPPWMAHLYPDTLPVTENGVRLEVGSRQQYCPSSSVYREMAAAFDRLQHPAQGKQPAVPACVAGAGSEGCGNAVGRHAGLLYARPRESQPTTHQENKID